METRYCKNCDKYFEHGVTGNMILFCPYCKKSAGSLSDYGFGPITPCDIYLGKEIIATITKDHRLISDRLGLNQMLKGKYANLEMYQEAEELVAKKL